MPYYACMECDVLVQKGEEPDYCPVCEEERRFRATFNIHQ